MQRNGTLGPTKRHPELLMLSSTTRPTGAKALSTGGGRRCCSFRAVAEIGKPNTQGVAARCPGLCAHCPFRTLTIPPPRRDVACYVSTDKGMYRKKACAPPCPTQHDPAIKVGTQRVAWEIVWDCGSSPQGHKRILTHPQWFSFSWP